MKTKEEWALAMDSAYVDTRSTTWTAEWIEQIQLDAFRAGMTEAAEIVKDLHNQSNRSYTHISMAILTVRDKKNL